MRRYVPLLFLCSVLLGNGGCVTTSVGTGPGAGVGTYSYINGALKALYAVPISELWDKTLTALQGLQLTIDARRMDGIGGEIIGRRADGTPVKIWFESMSQDKTLVSIKVDYLGNKKYAKRIHSAIQQQLGSS